MSAAHAQGITTSALLRGEADLMYRTVGGGPALVKNNRRHPVESYLCGVWLWSHKARVFLISLTLRARRGDA